MATKVHAIAHWKRKLKAHRNLRTDLGPNSSQSEKKELGPSQTQKTLGRKTPKLEQVQSQKSNTKPNTAPSRVTTKK